ncbi:MAG: phosphoribosylglycinamide formyltransferase [Chitinophagales bacterium]|nr:phosphoribosylglycinamide formyltransferase [Chitinophagales bacterium]
MKHIIIFASGAGTNARAIMQYFRHYPDVKIEAIICNKPKAGVIDVAQEFQVPYYLITRKDLYETDNVLNLLQRPETDLIVLAGFLWLIPENILQAFPGKIINIHPALLPSHGGDGMYGKKVHESVIHAKDQETGITIHYLNEKYDDGEVIVQKAVAVEPDDTAESLAKKVHELEHAWYPKTIAQLLGIDSVKDEGRMT